LIFINATAFRQLERQTARALNRFVTNTDKDDRDAATLGSAVSVNNAHHSVDDARHLVLCGGVAGNAALRSRLAGVAAAYGVELVCPPMHLCADNGVMIAWAGMEHLQAQLHLQATTWTSADTANGGCGGGGGGGGGCGDSVASSFVTAATHRRHVESTLLRRIYDTGDQIEGVDGQYVHFFDEVERSENENGENEKGEHENEKERDVKKEIDGSEEVNGGTPQALAPSYRGGFFPSWRVD
jgi:hypothetical protein